MKKLLVSGVIVLFIGMTISSSTGVYLKEQSIKPMSSGNILYVGGNGTGNYSTIQEAIDSASDGDSIFVYSGTYFERVKVNKSISLLGENKGTTVIDANGKDVPIFITADSVTVSGFTIQNGGNKPTRPDVGIDIRSNYNIISDNIVINNLDGIWLYDSSYSLISGNFITNNSDCGIWLGDFTSNCVVTDNSISNNCFGIGIIGGISNYNHNISSNTITYNHDGILMGDCDEINIWNNVIKNNFYIGIWSSRCDKTIISGNTIDGQGIYGILSDYCHQNTLTKNIVINNECGIHIQDSNDSFIIRNHVESNLLFGISLVSANGNIVSGNNIINNRPNGYFAYARSEYYDNEWDGNYWGRPRIFPKVIIGFKELITIRKLWNPIILFELDRNPSQEPYDIEV